MLNDEELQKLFDKIVEDRCNKSFKIAVIEGNIINVIKIEGLEKKKLNNGGLLLKSYVYVKDNNGKYGFSMGWDGTPLRNIGRVRLSSINDYTWGFYNVDTKEHKDKLDLILEKLDNMLNNKDVIITYSWA